MKNRTEEILKEIVYGAQWGDLMKVSPGRLATFLASLEARVEALEEPGGAGGGKLHDSQCKGEHVDENCVVATYPKEPVSWEERFEKNCRGYFFANGKDAYDGYDDDKLKAFIAQEKSKSFEEGLKMHQRASTSTPIS